MLLCAFKVGHAQKIILSNALLFVAPFFYSSSLCRLVMAPSLVSKEMPPEVCAVITLLTEETLGKVDAVDVVTQAIQRSKFFSITYSPASKVNSMAYYCMKYMRVYY